MMLVVLSSLLSYRALRALLQGALSCLQASSTLGLSYLLATMHKRALLPEVVCANAFEDLMLVTLSYQWCAYACTSELKSLWACGALLLVEARSINAWSITVWITKCLNYKCLEYYCLEH